MPTTITKTVKPAGGDYTSLSAWEAGEQANLVTLDQIRQAECYSMEDTTGVIVDGWTTDATRYLRIYTPASERHDGKWNTGKYRLKTTDALPLWLAEGFIRVEGLQIEVNRTIAGTTNGVDVQSGGSAGEIRISASIVRSTGSVNNGIGMDIGVASGSVVKTWNNIIYDFTRSGYYSASIKFNASGSTLYAYNNTLYGGYINLDAVAGTVIAKNNIAQGSQSNDYNGTFTSSNYNISGDATSTGGANDKINTTVSFVDLTNRDFHLAASDTAAKDAGTDLSGDANLAFSDDIDSQTRTGTWDIGADEYVVVGGVSFPIPHLWWSEA